jgi:hypothetical protein
MKPNNFKRKYVEELTGCDVYSNVSSNLEADDAILNGYRVKIKFPIDLFIKKDIINE